MRCATKVNFIINLGPYGLAGSAAVYSTIVVFRHLVIKNRCIISNESNRLKWWYFKCESRSGFAICLFCGVEWSGNVGFRPERFFSIEGKRNMKRYILGRSSLVFISVDVSPFSATDEMTARFDLSNGQQRLDFVSKKIPFSLISQLME